MLELQHAEDPAPLQNRLAANSHDLGADSVAPTDAGSSANSGEPVVSGPSPISSIGTSDPEFPLFVNLGPEPSLSAGLIRPKPKPTIDYKAAIAVFTKPRGRLAPFWLWTLFIFTATILVVAGLMAMVNPFRTRPGTPPLVVGSTPAQKPRSPVERNSTTTIAKTEEPIVVRNESDFDRSFSARELAEAVRTAIGVHGWIEFQNRKPIHLSSDQVLDFISGRGSLKMRAAPGTQPIIAIDVKDGKSWMTTGSAVTLELSGLTITVDYRQMSPTLVPAPVITAAGTATIERCAFRVADGSSRKGSRGCLLQWR